MSMRHALTTVIGKLVRVVARLRGGGSALPGLVAERLDPGYMARVLDRVPMGVVVVSGTNGKTSTTKMITEMLEALGFSVFTNDTGSNFSRGVVSAILAESSPSGRLSADIAVLELDEAHATHVVQQVNPTASLLLNVFVDQVDRFSNVAVTAGLLQRVADATTRVVVLNANDPYVSSITAEGRTVRWFGLGEEVEHLFPVADQILPGHGTNLDERAASNALDREPHVKLESWSAQRAVFTVGSEHFEAELHLVGGHQAVNAAAAIALVRAVLEDRGIDIPDEKIVRSIEAVRPAIGRGERLVVDGAMVELIMVKNPAGFRLSLLGFDPDAATMVAINNAVSDGVDPSWLEAVDVTPLAPVVDMCSGTQAEYLSSVLEAEGVRVSRRCEHIPKALHDFLADTAGRPKQIFANYTAIMELRKVLEAIAEPLETQP